MGYASKSFAFQRVHFLPGCACFLDYLLGINPSLFLEFCMVVSKLLPGCMNSFPWGLQKSVCVLQLDLTKFDMTRELDMIFACLG